MEKEEYKLINWWLSKHGDIYLLHGNNAAENGVPCVNTYELVETSRVLNVSENRKGFTFKTLNADFLCEINTTIDDRFEWLNDAMLWDLPLNKFQTEGYKKAMKALQEYQLESDIGNLVRQILPNEHIGLGISDRHDDYLAFAIYISEEGDEFVMDKDVIGQSVYIKYKSKEKDICRGYDIIDKNLINLDSNIGGTPLLIANTGANTIRVETCIGRFQIPPDARAYLIAPNMLRGRIPVYE